MQSCASLPPSWHCINPNQKTSPVILEGKRLQLSNFLIRNLTRHFFAISINISQVALAVLLRSKGKAVHIPQQHLHFASKWQTKSSCDAVQISRCPGWLQPYFSLELEGLCDSPQSRIFQTKHPASLEDFCIKTHGRQLFNQQFNQNSVTVRSSISGIELQSH